MRDGHVGHVNAVKNIIRLFEDETVPLSLASYCARPKGKDFGKVEISNIHDKSVTEPAQFEFAAQMDFTPKKA